MGGVIALAAFVAATGAVAAMVTYFQFIKPNRVDMKGAAVRGFLFDPPSLRLKIKDFDYVEKFAVRYVPAMAGALTEIGVSATEAAIWKHLSRVRVHLHEGYLKSHVREQYGLNDLNGDGKKDLITGLTHGLRDVEVALVDTMKREENYSLMKSALDYELHNTCLLAFTESDLVLAESFVPDGDTRLSNWLDVTKISKLKTKRAVLDAVYKTARRQAQE